MISTRTGKEVRKYVRKQVREQVRDKVREQVRVAPSADSRLINLPPDIGNFEGTESFLLNSVCVLNSYWKLLMIGKFPRLATAKFLVLFSYLYVRAGQVRTRDTLITGVTLGTAEYHMAHLRQMGYIERVAVGQYILSDKGAEIYNAIVTELHKQLTGPFRWRP